MTPKQYQSSKPYYTWKEISILPHKKNWLKFESNIKSVVLHVLFIVNNKTSTYFET